MRTMNIVTFGGKTKQVRGQARSLLLKVEIKLAFDRIAKEHGDMNFAQATTKVAEQLSLTPQRVRDILTKDWEFKVRQGYPLKYTFQQGINKRLKQKVWLKFKD